MVEWDFLYSSLIPCPHIHPPLTIISQGLEDLCRNWRSCCCAWGHWTPGCTGSSPAFPLSSPLSGPHVEPGSPLSQDPMRGPSLPSLRTPCGAPLSPLSGPHAGPRSLLSQDPMRGPALSPLSGPMRGPHCGHSLDVWRLLWFVTVASSPTQLFHRLLM